MISDVSAFLNMGSDELYDHLISYAMTGSQAKVTIDELKRSQRYAGDYQFRAMLDFADILNEGAVQGPNQKLLVNRVMRCVEIMERATNLEMWQLVANSWVAMGSFYQQSYLYERALESFTHGLRVEQEHGLYMLSPIIYLNMIFIFVELDELEKSLDLVRKAEELLEKHADTIPRYWTKYILIQEWYLRLKVIQGVSDREQLKVHYDRIMQAPVDQLTHPYRAIILSCRFYYGFLFFEQEKLDEILEKVKEEYGKQEYVIHLQHCIDLSKRFERDYETYVQRLAEFEEDDELFLTQVNVTTYKLLSAYYQEKGDNEKLAFSRLKHIEYSEKYLDELLKQQGFAIHTIEELLLSQDLKNKSSVENVEFKLIANEAIQTKRELEKAYDRIAIIGELGKKLTATTDLNEVISTIFRIIKEHLPVDYFALMYYDEEHRCLRSVAIYYQDELQEELVIEIDDEKSSSAQCFKTKEILKYYGKIDREKRRIHIYDDCDSHDMLSRIFVPLVVADKPIGVFSLQSASKKAYEGENLEFLKEIEPYLSIALNNAVKSMLIEKESEERKRIQKELEDANAILSKISSMDGLTQISSRRAFEERFKECLAHTEKEKTSLSVFMMDIDFFKRYNDTYGHLEGDEVLKKVAKIFREHLKKFGGLSARFGGEEFIGAVAGLTEKEALEVASDICNSIASEKIEHESSPLGIVTASIGISTIEQVDNNMQSDLRSKLMRTADECLYKAKASGKNTYVLGMI